MRKLLAILSISLISTTVSAATRCILDTSNQSITHTSIPIHGGLQGITQYNNPSEWPYFSNQSQWQTSDGIMRHVHIEWCAPYWGEITGSVVIPFRIQTYLQSGQMAWNVSGPLVRDIVWETYTTPILSDPTGVSIATGHLTLDPFLTTPSATGNGISQASPNGWTKFQIGFQYRQANGDVLSPAGFLPIYTILNSSIPNTDKFFGPLIGPYNGLNTNPLGVDKGNSWGVQSVNITDALPLLAPISTIWPIPSLVGYTYGANGGQFQTGVTEIKADVDLHHGNPGRLLHAVTSMTGKYLDPAEIGSGTHNIFINWTTMSGPNGIPGIAAPNEMQTTVFEFTVTIGDSVTPPPNTVDCVVGQWLNTSTSTSTTPAITNGNNQTRSIIVTTNQERPILTQPQNGGVSCPVN